MLSGFDREDDLDSTYQTTGQNRPYRKRHCGYWDFEQSEPSSMGYEEAKESGKDCRHHRSGTQVCDDCRNSENVDYGNPSPGTNDNWLTGSPGETWKAEGHRGMNGYIDWKNLNYNPADSQETEQWTGHRGLDDSLGNFGQPQDWHMEERSETCIFKHPEYV